MVRDICRPCIKKYPLHIYKNTINIIWKYEKYLKIWRAIPNNTLITIGHFSFSATEKPYTYHNTQTQETGNMSIVLTMAICNWKSNRYFLFH